MSFLSVFCIFCLRSLPQQLLTAGPEQAERMVKNMQEATQGLTSITHVFRANFFFWAVCLACALFILLQRQGIEVKGCKAVKVMLINSEKIQNSEGIHQIRSLWLPIQCHCALIRLPSYRVQTSERSSTIAKYFLLLQGFSSKKKLC